MPVMPIHGPEAPRDCTLPGISSDRAMASATPAGVGENHGMVPVVGTRTDFKFEVDVVRFQRSVVQTTQWWEPGVGSRYVCAVAADDLGVGSNRTAVSRPCHNRTTELLFLGKHPAPC